MAKYTVKFDCGHEEVINICGSHTERERKIAYAKYATLITETGAKYYIENR